jgi:folate-binding protein YgfZ
MFSNDEYRALRERAGLLDRGDRGRLQLTGADRRSYLQGLLTNDITALGPGRGCYAALLTPQGRMVSDMRVSELGDRVLIDLPAATAGTVKGKLEDFIFSEDVEVQDVRPALAAFGLYGPGAASLVASVAADTDAGSRLSALPPDGNAVLAFEGRSLVVVSSGDFGVPGFELFVDASVGDRLEQALVGAGAVPVSAGTAAVTRIEAGRPEFGVDMDEHTIPLEAGIEDRAISLTKGCYVGQEVIIRVLHRGQGRVARHLVGVVGEAEDTVLAPDARLASGGKDVGAVTSAAWSPALSRPIALASVHRDHVEPGRTLEVQGAETAATVTVTALPFTPREA